MSLLRTAACGSLACSRTPTEPLSSASATIENVVLTRRGAPIGADPVTLDPQEVVEVAIHLTLDMPAAAPLTLYLCVLESASSPVGRTCNGLSTTPERLGSVLQTAIRPPVAAGATRTTSYLYVAVIEGAFPWAGAFTGQGGLPNAGDRFGANRVLHTYQTARTFTFR